MIGLLDEDAKARILAGLLVPLQEEQYQLGLLRAANGSKRDDTVPGQNFTYAERLAELGDAEERLLAAAEDTIVERLRGFQNGD